MVTFGPAAYDTNPVVTPTSARANATADRNRNDIFMVSSVTGDERLTVEGCEPPPSCKALTTWACAQSQQTNRRKDYELGRSRFQQEGSYAEKPERQCRTIEDF